MYQNFNYFPQQPQQQAAPQQPIQQQPNYNYLRQSSQTGLKGRPVASIEEARAMSIDFDGSIFFFPDLANRRIYTKQINMDGTATLNLYELKEVPAEPPQPNYITREEFENVIAQIKDAMVERTQVPQQPVKQQPAPQIPASIREEIKQF